MNDLVERFLRYVKIDTQSDENTNTHPSSEKQHNLAKVLVEDLKSLGVANITYDKEHCYV
ncbi:MAG: peptidase T, partial [Lachnospiraceae bacterium]|nr:peptidase T [Lachnospiraceae bacterium]